MKLGLDYIYKCEDELCGWEGKYPIKIEIIEFLKVNEDNCEEGYIEVCPECRKLAVYKYY